MKKKRIYLIPATLLFLFYSCQQTAISPKEVPQNPPFKREESIEFSPNNTSELIEPPFPLPDVWDTAWVDTADVDESRKLISFTFDDAPSRTLESILAVFAAFNEENPDCIATATVFCNSHLFDGQSIHLLHAACALGFELGNHTHSHRNLATLTVEEITEEIDRTDQALQKIDGRSLHLLRAPFGSINERVKEAAKTPLIDWTIDTLDWTKNGEEAVYTAVWNGKCSGAIVLMHDGYGHTVSALKRLLPDLKKSGYQVVSLSKMIKAHGCKCRRGGVYIRARKQN